MYTYTLIYIYIKFLKKEYLYFIPLNINIHSV